MDFMEEYGETIIHGETDGISEHVESMGSGTGATDNSPASSWNELSWSSPEKITQVSQ